MKTAFEGKLRADYRLYSRFFCCLVEPGGDIKSIMIRKGQGGHTCSAGGFDKLLGERRTVEEGEIRMGMKLYVAHLTTISDVGCRMSDVGFENFQSQEQKFDSFCYFQPWLLPVV